MRSALPRLLALVVIAALVGVWAGMEPNLGVPGWVSWVSASVAAVALVGALWLAGRANLDEFDRAELVRWPAIVTASDVAPADSSCVVRVSVSPPTGPSFAALATLAEDRWAQQLRPGDRVLVELWSHSRHSGTVVEVTGVK